MSSGLDYSSAPSHADSLEPNANSFYEAGWNLNVDSTVVRTDGDQQISGVKLWKSSVPLSSQASIHMGDKSNLHLLSGSEMNNQAGSAQYIMGDALVMLRNKSNFQFVQLDYPPAISP